GYLEDPNAWVSTGLVTRLLALAEDRARDPWVGLHAGEYVEPRSPLFHLLQSSPRVEEGLRLAQRFGGLLIDTLRLAVRTERAMVSLVFDPGDAAFSSSRHAMEYLLMASVSAMRHSIGTSCRFREVHFRHRRTGRHDEAERAFGCPVYFGQPDNLAVLPLSALWEVPRFANRAVAEHLEKFVAGLATRTTKRICERTERAIRSLLASGVRATSVSVARSIGTTSRTLQRKLAEEGTSFRELRDATLWDAV